MLSLTPVQQPMTTVHQASKDSLGHRRVGDRVRWAQRESKLLGQCA